MPGRYVRMTKAPPLRRLSVIVLGEDGHIFGVVMPEEGWGNLEDFSRTPWSK